MPLRTVFTLTNNEVQGGAEGICTAASMRWCKLLLEGKSVESWEDMGLTVHTLNAQMAIVRNLDSNRDRQCLLGGLKPVGPDRPITSLDEMFTTFKGTTPHIGLFWTRHHTMAYRYVSGNKEFFDMNQGLFRSSTTAPIKKKIVATYFGYDNEVTEYRVVTLAD